MEITLLGQQYNVGEKPTVVLYISPCRDTRKTLKTKQRQRSTPSHMVVVILYYVPVLHRL